MQETWRRIADRVQAATRPPELTKSELAHQLGISRAALNRRLAGEVNWHKGELILLADALHIPVDQLTNHGDAA